MRANAAEAVAIYLRQLAALRTVAQRTTRPDYRRALRQQTELTLAAAEKNITVGYEIEQVHQHYRDTLAALG